MARIKYETGKFPEHMGERILSWRIPLGGTVDDAKPKPSQAQMDTNAKLWRDLYRAVDKVWKLPAMIETTTVNGRPAQVAYIGIAGEGTVEPGEAVLIKVCFTDAIGGIAFLDPKSKAAPTAKKSLRAARAREEAEKTLARLTRAERARETLADLRKPSRKARGYPEYDPNQPRDEAGRFGSGGGGAESAGGKPSSSGASAKPKGKGKAKKEDFEKAGVKLYVSDEEKFLRNLERKGRYRARAVQKRLSRRRRFHHDDRGRPAPASSLWAAIFSTRAARSANTTATSTSTTSRPTALFSRSRRQRRKATSARKVLAGNVAMYESLGIEKVSVTANIDVGGYAWAKYGYVPTTSAWNALRASLLSKVGATRGTTTNSGNTVEAEEWGMLNDDQQQAVEARWMEDSFSEFLSSEQNNWRDSGRALDDAKQSLADNFVSGPEWATEALDKARAGSFGGWSTSDPIYQTINFSARSALSTKATAKVATIRRFRSTMPTCASRKAARSSPANAARHRAPRPV